MIYSPYISRPVYYKKNKKIIEGYIWCYDNNKKTALCIEDEPKEWTFIDKPNLTLYSFNLLFKSKESAIKFYKNQL